MDPRKELNDPVKPSTGTWWVQGDRQAWTENGTCVEGMKWLEIKNIVNKKAR